MKIEQLLYFPFGNNLIIGRHIEDQLKFLSEVLPSDFKGKEMYDLGCGDGKITVFLKKFFESKLVFGCDASGGLVKRAKKRGVESKVVDLEKEVPVGELAVMWGVLHHLRNQEKVLEKIKNNFNYFFLREPLLKEKSFFELGDPFKKEELEDKIKRVFGDYKIFEHKNAAFIFWKKYV